MYFARLLPTFMAIAFSLFAAAAPIPDPDATPMMKGPGSFVCPKTLPFHIGG